MKTTLFKYIFNMQIKTMIFISFFMFCLILLFDFAEVTRKFPISNMEQTIFAIKLSLLRTPNTFCEIVHYIYFISATFSLWHLTSSNQMTILKSMGRSPQQILFPFVNCAFFISLVWLFILHPCGNYTEEAYNELVNSNSHKINESIWIDYLKDNKLVFINKIEKNDIDGLYIFDLKNNKKIFAKEAVVYENVWDLHDVTIVDNNINTIKNIAHFGLYNRASNELISLLSKTPRKHDIYSLWKVYKIQNENHVSLKLYELELHKLLANCMFFILFALIAAAICFPINRYKTKTTIAMSIIGLAMILRFANNMLDSLARTGILNGVLAAWAVVIAAIFISIGVLVWKEV